MKDQAQFEKFNGMLKQAQRVLLIAHKKPDGDTLGASVSMLNYLVASGKRVVAFCATPVPEQYAYLPLIDRFTSDPTIFEEKYDLICVFDSGDLRYAGVADFVDGMRERPFIVNLDHHATNENFGDLNLLFIDASSTAEVVHRFYRANKIEIDASMATALLTGILTDTSNFINPATNATCIQAASNLMICGARIGEITSSLVRNKSIPGLQLWGRALERLRENRELGIASTLITQKDLAETGTEGGEAVEGIANFLGATLDVPAIMVLREMPGGEVKGSLRSATRDVSKIAKLLGGGGHKKAAGFTVKGKIVVKDGIWQVE
jgi:bifunctional oligoribonuclease and PAP phosphatase NrnA